jgi:hypothetical protein
MRERWSAEPLAASDPSGIAGPKDFGYHSPVQGVSLDHSRAEAAADARRQRAKLYSEYCELFATKQMRPESACPEGKNAVFGLLVLRRKPAFL